MPKVQNVKLKCGKCGCEFPWPISVPDSETLERVLIEGKMTNCPTCGTSVNGDKDHLRYEYVGTSGGQEDNFKKI
jgi:endogenous inhibitor of DNA gyrase (YacG/DUF329 family)